MKSKLIPVLLVFLLLLSMPPLSTGYSNGIHNQGTGCGGGYCHGSNTNAVVSMSGQPASYTAGQSYTLSISVTGGVQGSTDGGFSLEVDKGTLSSGIGFAVNVNSAQDSATHSITGTNQRSWSVDWTAPSSGSGVVTFDLAGNAVDGGGNNSNDNWDAISYQVPEAGAAPNNPPSATNLQLSPSNPVTTDTLILTYSFNDSDGDTESGTQVHWYRDGVLENSRTDQTTVPPGLTTKGETWNVTVTPSDGSDNGTPVHSNSLLVVNSMPMVTSAEITPSSANENDNLSVSLTSSDADNDVRTISGIEWYVDDAKVSAFDGDIEIPSVAIRTGDVWYAKVKVNDGEIDSPWFTTQDIIIGSDNTAPTMTSVSLGGPYTTLDDLIATAIGNDIDGDILTYEWDWPGTFGTVTTDTLPSTHTEKGESWTVRCRVTDGEVYSDWMESSAVVIQNSVPVLESLMIDQETVFFENEATYSFTATDADSDQLTTNEVWTLEGNILTLSLSVSDDSSNSNSLSDSVQIVNSLPVASYDGPIVVDALNDLAPFIDTYDANGDDVNISWNWMRNGFSTEFTDGIIPSERIGAGDVWLAMVTPNDGIDNGQVLQIPFTISNTEPIAVITPPENLIQGSSVTFSAMDSSDADGAVVNAIWSIDGMVVGSGMTFTTSMVQELNLKVKVIDDMGAEDSESDTFFGTEPPYATNTVAESDGSEVVITWSGNAEEWAVVHNGEVIDTTSSKKYRHSPSLEGNHTYSILPVLDGQIIQWDSMESKDTVNLKSSVIPEPPGPSDTAGLVFSIVLLLAGIAGLALSFIPRRD